MKLFLGIRSFDKTVAVGLIYTILLSLILLLASMMDAGTTYGGLIIRFAIFCIFAFPFAVALTIAGLSIHVGRVVRFTRSGRTTSGYPHLVGSKDILCGSCSRSYRCLMYNSIYANGLTSFADVFVASCELYIKEKS